MSICVFDNESRKKTVFFIGLATKAFPPPLELSGHKIFSRFFLELQKTVFFLSGQTNIQTAKRTEKKESRTPHLLFTQRRRHLR